jgi:hypothetical protein
VGRFATHQLVISALIPSIIDRAWAIYGFWLLGHMNQKGTGGSPQSTPTKARRGYFLVPLFAGLGAMSLNLASIFSSSFVQQKTSPAVSANL